MPINKLYYLLLITLLGISCKNHQPKILLTEVGTACDNMMHSNTVFDLYIDNPGDSLAIRPSFFTAGESSHFYLFTKDLKDSVKLNVLRMVPDTLVGSGTIQLKIDTDVLANFLNLTYTNNINSVVEFIKSADFELRYIDVNEGKNFRINKSSSCKFICNEDRFK